jgi:glucosamine-phosphate N-acetyltransferase
MKRKDIIIPIHIKGTYIKEPHIRELCTNDYYRNFLQLLNKLSKFDYEKITFDDFYEYNNKYMDKKNNTQIYVIESEGLIIGCGTLLIEHKFIHNLSKVGHIEDVIIDEKYRNMGLGKKLINKLVDIASNNLCYKVILDCSKDKEIFYEKCGFTNMNSQMSIYF